MSRRHHMSRSSSRHSFRHGASRVHHLNTDSFVRRGGTRL